MFKNVGNTARGVAWNDLHAQMLADKTNILYLTATPGVDLSELKYLYGLRVWRPSGFEDWIKIITGQESPDKVKQRQQAQGQVDTWVDRVKTAENKVDAQPITVSGYQGFQVGRVQTYKTTERYNGGRFYMEVEGTRFIEPITNEIEAKIVADKLNTSWKMGVTIRAVSWVS